MTFRTTALAIIFSVAAIPAAFANTGYTAVGGEAGFNQHRTVSERSREQVRQEYLQFRKQPVTADGTVVLQGEAGYLSASQGAFADNKPSGPHTHAMGNAPAPSVQPAPVSAAEGRAYREQYAN